MSNILVAYFSASGVTARVAKELAHAAGAELYEIVPETPYTKADLNWMDQNARSTVEMKDPASRPAIAGTLPDLAGCDVLFIGFPIWWYVAPTIINTFLEHYDLTGKTIIPFATSGGSGMGDTNQRLRPSCSGATLLPGKLLNGRQSKESLTAWLSSIPGVLGRQI